MSEARERARHPHDDPTHPATRGNAHLPPLAARDQILIALALGLPVLLIASYLTGQTPSLRWLSFDLFAAFFLALLFGVTAAFFAAGALITGQWSVMHGTPVGLRGLSFMLFTSLALGGAVFSHPTTTVDGWAVAAAVLNGLMLAAFVARSKVTYGILHAANLGQPVVAALHRGPTSVSAITTLVVALAISGYMLTRTPREAFGLSLARPATP